MALATTRLLLIFSLLFSSTFTLAMGVCNPRDQNALIAIKKAFHDPDLLSSWVVGTNCCRWEHVGCDNNNRIVELEINPGVHNINKISGSISSSIGDLSHLKSLSLAYINTTGSIPPSIANLKSLQYLILYQVNLKGLLPLFLTKLPNLYYIQLSCNNFSGPILSEFSNLAKLMEIYLDNNNLSGTIPKSLAHLDFETVDLSGNKLAGDASMFFKKKNYTEYINLSRNKFEFDFSQVRFSNKLRSLDISHNNINGSIPTAITKLPHLEALDMSYNQLCGEIPKGRIMNKFNASSYIQNRCLCGAPLKKCF